VSARHGKSAGAEYFFPVTLLYNIVARNNISSLSHCFLWFYTAAESVVVVVVVTTERFPSFAEHGDGGQAVFIVPSLGTGAAV
jgi:hypothetical protein